MGILLKENTYLFVPGIKEKVIEKALNSKCDVVIIDLEDSVAEDEKGTARGILQNFISKSSHNKKVIVRINDLNSAYWQKDLETCFSIKVDGIMLPKAESGKDIEKIGELISQYAGKEGFELIPLIESAKGVQFAYEIASAHSSVSKLAFGSVDYSLDIGAVLTKEGEELLYPKGVIVVASKAAGIKNPIDSVFMDLNDGTGLMQETEKSKKMGFQAKMLIHPKQIEVVNKVFIPTSEELKEAENIVIKFESALDRGLASISYKGKLVDYPVYKQALELLRSE